MSVILSAKGIKMGKKSGNKNNRMVKRKGKSGNRCWLANKISYVLDMAFLCVFITGIALETNDKFCFELELNTLAFDIVAVLLPAVITIISISLQMQDEMILGVSIKNLSSIRTGIHYSLLHMIIIAIAVFSFELVTQIFGLPISALIVDILAILLSLLFSVFELPLLMKSERSAKRIIRKAFIAYDGDVDKTNSQQGNGILSEAVSFLLINRGIKSTFKDLKNNKMKDSILLDILLTKQDSLLYELNDSLEISKNNPFITFESENNILTVLNTSYRNLFELMDLSDDFNYLLFDKSGLETYQLTRPTFKLHKASSLLNIKFEKEASNYHSIILNYFFDIKGANHSTLYNNYLSIMSCYSLVEGDPWFAKLIRDFDYSPIYFDPDKYTIIYFLTIYSCFVINSKYINERIKNNVLLFLNEKSRGLNSDGDSWLYKFKKTVENFHSASIVFEVLKSLLSFCSSVKDHSYDIAPKLMSVYSYDDSTHFGKELIIDYWLQIIVYHPYFYYDENECLEFFNSLDDDLKRDFVGNLERRWLANDTIKNNKETPFFDFVFGDSQTKRKPNDELVKAFVKIKNSYCQKAYEASFEPANEETLTKIKQSINEAVPTVLSKFKLDSSITLEEEREFSFNLRLEGDDILSLLKVYLGRLSDGLANVSRDLISKNAVHYIFKNYKYSKEDVDKIIELRPSYSGQISHLAYSCNEEQSKIIKEMQIEKLFYLPNNSFVKEGAVKINIEYKIDETVPRFLSEKELEEIIDKEYVQTNGLYRFSNYKTYEGSFLVTKDHLKELLRERIIFGPIVFKMKAITKKEEVLVFDYSD